MANEVKSCHFVNQQWPEINEVDDDSIICLDEVVPWLKINLNISGNLYNWADWYIYMGEGRGGCSKGKECWSMYLGLGVKSWVFLYAYWCYWLFQNTEQLPILWKMIISIIITFSAVLLHFPQFYYLCHLHGEGCLLIMIHVELYFVF